MRKHPPPARLIRVVVLYLVVAGAARTARGMYLYYSAEGTLTFDSNIPRNLTDYSGYYAVPRLFARLREVGGLRPLSLWFKSTYGTYLVERSARLNPPLLKGGVSLDFDEKELRWDAGAMVASYYYRGLRTARLRYEFDAGIQRRIGGNRLGLDAKVCYNDFGDNDDDGLRLTTRGSYAYRFRVLQSRVLALRRLEAAVMYRRNDARSDSSSYHRFELRVGGEVKIARAELNLYGEIRQKRYDGVVLNRRTGEHIEPLNRYLYGGGKLEVAVWRGLSAGLEGKLRFKNSTYPPYDYDRYSAGLFVRWAGTVGKS